MPEQTSAQDAEPSHPTPAGTLFVPVRSGSSLHCVRLFRTPPGGRTAVAFTSLRQLADTLGTNQAWIRLSEPALRALVAPLGVTALTVDPLLAAPAPVPAEPAPVPVRAAVAALAA